MGVTLLLLLSVAGTAVVGVSADESDATPIDGGDNRDDAPVLQKGEEYKVTTGWYKIYVDKPGSKISAKFTDIENDDIEINRDGTDLLIEGTNIDAFSRSPEYEYIIKNSGYTYIHLDADQYAVRESSRLQVTTESPDTNTYDVESVTSIPEEIEPGEETTLQAEVRYEQSGLINNERGNVEILINGEVVHTEQISPGQGNSVFVTAAHNISSTGETGDRTITARAAPNWTGPSEGTQAETTLSVDATDLDSDGLYDFREEELGTDPKDADSDGDGLDDGQEVELGTDPLVADTDDDGLSDKQETDGETDPLVADTDGDGLNDGREIELGTDPLETDTDGDGFSDYREVEELDTDPTSADTDGDGLNDSEEFQEGADPTQSDTDGDGLPDAQELEIGTDPEAVDTDGDGVSDYEEYQQGTDPLSETDTADNQLGNDTQVLEDRSLIVNSETVSLQLRSARTIVEQDQPAVLTFSSAALISASDTVRVQLILEAPSGVSVTNADFTESGLGQYTTTLELEPGDTEGLRITLNANEQGRFGVTGRAVYYIGDNRENATIKQVTIPVQVVGQENTQPDTDSSGTGESDDDAENNEAVTTTSESGQSKGIMNQFRALPVLGQLFALVCGGVFLFGFLGGVFYAIKNG